MLLRPNGGLVAFATSEGCYRAHRGSIRPGGFLSRASGAAMKRQAGQGCPSLSPGGPFLSPHVEADTRGCLYNSGYNSGTPPDAKGLGLTPLLPVFVCFCCPAAAQGWLSWAWGTTCRAFPISAFPFSSATTQDGDGGAIRGRPCPCHHHPALPDLHHPDQALAPQAPAQARQPWPAHGRRGLVPAALVGDVVRLVLE